MRLKTLDGRIWKRLADKALEADGEDVGSAKIRRGLMLGGVSLAATGLSACGGGNSPDPAPAGSSNIHMTSNQATGAMSAMAQTDAARFLLQAQFSASDSDIASLTQNGITGWLNSQYKAPIAQTGWQWLDAQGCNAIDASLKFFYLGYADNMLWNQLITQKDTLRKRVALALSEYFVVSANPFDKYWPAYMIAAYWDLLNKYAFGNFRDLLEAVTLNPAMGRFLNTRGNLKENSAGRQPDENYAREVMQLFTIGLYQLNKDGTYVVDSRGMRVPTYGQDDVTSLAHVFTGYDYDTRLTTYTSLTVNGATYKVPSREFCSAPMIADPNGHSTLSVSFLGTIVPSGATPPSALKMALDTLFNHPNVGPFFCRQMIQRLVTSNPSPAYVTRVAVVFNNNGAGVRGDLKAVWTAILTDAEARPASPADTSGKLREPIIRFVQICQTLNARSTTGTWSLYDLSKEGWGLAQSPLRAPSVFNFFRPDYTPPGSTLATQGLAAPEFQIVNETSVAGYLNILMGFLKNGVKDVVPDYSAIMTLASDSARLLDWLNLHLCAGQLSSGTIVTVKQALDTYPVKSDSPDSKRIDTLQSAIFLVMASTDYLVQK